MHFTPIEKEQSLLRLERKSIIHSMGDVCIWELPTSKYRAVIWHVVVTNGVDVSKFLVDVVFTGTVVNYSVYAKEGVVSDVYVAVDYQGGSIKLQIVNNNVLGLQVSSSIISNLTI